MDNLEEELQASNFYIPRNKPLAFFFTLSSSLLLIVRFRLRYLVTTVYKKSLSLSLFLRFNGCKLVEGRARFGRVFHAIRASAMENICRFRQVARGRCGRRAIVRAERHVFFSSSSFFSSSQPLLPLSLVIVFAMLSLPPVLRLSYYLCISTVISTQV